MIACHREWPGPIGGSGRARGAFKVDFAVEGGVPWTNPTARTGRHRARGRLASPNWPPPNATFTPGACPTRPFVLVGQQYLADPAALGRQHPSGWTYAHVPNGYTR